MYNWFECKVKFEKIAAEGSIIKFSESYLVDAFSFTEAEERITREMKPFISGEFTVANIKRVKINEIFFDESGDKWYRSKVNFVTYDEESQTEKRTAVTMFIQAADFTHALENLKKGMQGTMADYEIASITETLLIDVFRFQDSKVLAQLVSEN
jgi:hypothetical protein